MTDGLDSATPGDDSITSPFCQKRLTISQKPAGIFFVKLSRACVSMLCPGTMMQLAHRLEYAACTRIERVGGRGKYEKRAFVLSRE